MTHVDAKPRGHAPRRLLALCRDRFPRTPSGFQHRRRRRLRRTAVERRLGRVLHIELQGLGDLIAAEIGGNVKGPVDARRHTGRKDKLPVFDHPLVDWNSAEKRQQMEGTPVRRRPLSRPAAPKISAPVHTEKTHRAPSA